MCYSPSSSTLTSKSYKTQHVYVKRKFIKNLLYKGKLIGIVSSLATHMYP